jgi:ribulose-5-phosphate 4-epimerase/fuculose-1-phosphate aldolase
MSAAEGVIRFEYQLERAPAPLATGADFVRLNAWRSILHRLSLIGQCASRYDGYAFGNVSLRCPQNPATFLITASQTSGKPRAEPEDWTQVNRPDLRQFRVDAVGLLPPSSESMTHAMIYQADSQVSCVLHVHSPDIWTRTDRLVLPHTGTAAAYGTPDLASHVRQLFRDHAVRPLVFTTLGHEDGVFACGRDVDSAAHALMDVLAAALSAEPANRP